MVIVVFGSIAVRDHYLSLGLCSKVGYCVRLLWECVVLVGEMGGVGNGDVFRE